MICLKVCDSKPLITDDMFNAMVAKAVKEEMRIRQQQMMVQQQEEERRKQLQEKQEQQSLPATEAVANTVQQHNGHSSPSPESEMAPQENGTGAVPVSVSANSTNNSSEPMDTDSSNMVSSLIFHFTRLVFIMLMILFRKVITAFF